MTGARALLSVEDLAVSFRTELGVVRAVEGASFELRSGEVLAIVGESGSGKSVTAMTLMGLTRGPGTEIAGRASLEGVDLIGASEPELRGIRGRRIAMVFQDSMTGLDPVQRVGAQVAEQITVHEPVSDAAARARAVELLGRVGIPQPAERAGAYPHELSGGMRQRVMIAMALSCEPAVLIADEPTTALDVTIQAQVIERIRELREATGAAVILVTHDLGVVAEIADRVAVMYAGRIVEQGTLDELFYDPLHPYTWGLLGSIARIDGDRPGRLPSIAGAPPSMLDKPPGCHFAPRCPHEFGRCGEPPSLARRADGSPDHLDRCWLSTADKRRRRDVGGRIGLGT